jgi:hypothetical protein
MISSGKQLTDGIYAIESCLTRCSVVEWIDAFWHKCGRILRH